MNKISYILLVISVAFGCSDSDEAKRGITSLEALNQFVASSTVQEIDLNNIEYRDVNIDQENIIYSIHDEIREGNSALGHIESSIHLNDSFFIKDLSTNSIYEIDRVGNIIKALARAGKGPGEIGSGGGIYYNSHHIFVPDYNNGRVNRYTHDMRIVDALKNFLMTDFSVSEKFIFGSNQNSRGFYPADANEGLIVVSSVNSLEDTISTVMPRIIPEGYQPQVYNSVRFSANRKGEMIAAYAPLPWIFIYDDNHRHVNTLILEYDAFDSLDIPNMDLFKPKNNEGYGGQTPINSMKLMNNGDIFLTLRNEILHLNKVDGEYSTKETIRFSNDLNNVSSYWTWVYNKVISMDDDYIYIVNPEYLFKIDRIK